MELRQLKFFIKVAEERSLSAAARHLNISQPPVTRYIQQLEAELGHDLFVRTARGVRLTPAGAAFLPEARKLLAQAERAVERSQAAASGEIGVLEVGYFGAAIYTYLPHILRCFRIVAPSAEVSLRQLSKVEQVDALIDGRLDVGFAHYYSGSTVPHDSGLVVEKICEERLFYATARDAALQCPARIALEDIGSRRLILAPRNDRPSFADDVIAMFTRLGLVPNVNYLAEDLNAALALTDAGYGSTIVPETLTWHRWSNVTFIPLLDETKVPINCIHGPQPLSPILDMFMTVVGKAMIQRAQESA